MFCAKKWLFFIFERKGGRKLEQFKKECLAEIGKRLYECRTNRKWSQLYVAEKMNVSTNTISAIENGAQQFNLMILLRFSELYGVSTDYILKGEILDPEDSELFKKITKLPIMEQRRVLAAINAFYEIC